MVRRVMMIAGEASGDLHGAGVVRQLMQMHHTLEIFGVGGDNMRREGMQLVYHVSELSVMGFAEVAKQLPRIYSVEKALEQLLLFKKPDVVVLIDYPGFNLRFAKIAKRNNIPVVYYISPQVWAWRKSRIKKMKGIVDRMLVVFPFEVELYKEEGIDAEFVGHPLLEVLKPGLEREGFFKRYGLDPVRPVLGLLPGSRVQEIERIFPNMISAARRVAAESGAQVVIGVAPTLDEKYFTTMYNVNGAQLIKGATYDVMSHSDVALVTSGTATLETACLGTPLIVVYKTSWITYLIGRLFVRIKNIGLVNIVAGKQIAPEYIQHEATSANLAREALRLLNDKQAADAMRAELGKIKGMLGEHGAAQKVAERILQMA
ncbi:MAG: lipid-A-disaccharide synthase [Ignavibacteriae bacterium]|nr:lipid-A-disaccharide synthase [Ignavibacteriota bacterium]